MNVFAAQAEAEYAVADPDLQFTLESENPRAKAIDKDTAKRLLQALYAAPHGVYAMSQDIPGLVETSTNLASVKMNPGNIIRIETSSAALSSRPNKTSRLWYVPYSKWQEQRIFRRRLSGLEAQSALGNPGNCGGII